MSTDESVETKLARLDEKLDYVLRDIKELKDGTSDKIADHEKRLRALEENVIFKNYYDEHHENLVNQVSKLSRYIYIGIGGLMAFQILLDLYFKLKQ